MTDQLTNAMGRFAIIIALISLIFFVPIAVSFAQEIELPDDPLAGQKVFLKKGCVDCHSIYGKGGKIARDLGKMLEKSGPPGIFAAMWNHSPEMTKLMQKPQEIPIFSEQEMADLIAYFYFLSYLDEDGDIEKGRIVLKQKACLTCHSVGGVGGEMGPPLDKVRGYAHPLSLAQDMWNHAIKMSAAMSAHGIQRPRFTGSEITDLFAYLREISTQEVDAGAYLTPGRPKAGERLFEEKGCFQCHKIGNKGNAVGPDLTQTEFHTGVTRIAGKLWNHGPRIWEKMEEMRIKPPVFEKNELADLVAYLYFLDFIKQSGNAETGNRLFAAKGCAACHSIRGRGGNVGPDLAESDKTANYLNITTAMWNHNLKMRILMDKIDVPMPRFTPQEMKDLFFFLSAERSKYEY